MTESDLDFDPEELEMLRQLFRSEAHDALEAVTTRILSGGSARPSHDALTEMMRVTHTIKGAAGTVGLNAMVELAHRLESAFAIISREPPAWTPATADLIVEVTDGLRGYLDQLVAKPTDAEPAAVRLRAQIARIVKGAPEPPPRPEQDVPDLAAGDSLSMPTVTEAGEPESMSDLPSEGVLEPRAPVTSEASRYLRVEPERIDSLMSSAGELLFDRTRIERRVQLLRTIARDLARTRQNLRDAIGTSGHRGLAETESELAGQAALLSQTTAALLDEIEALRRTIGELQRGLTRIRMETARNLFLHAARTLRALRRATGVKVELRTLGEDTEFDKAVAEQLVDPITQLLRNAVAHGIEPPEEREAHGKPAIAMITIRARQDGNLLVIELSDDGRGVDTTALRDRLVATNRWSLARAQLATDADVLDALGTGVSIRGDADELAGRGIGLDLVRQTIARLGGEVKVSSVTGRGTTFSLRLPLSTSLAQAMLFKVGGQVYAIPAVHVIDTTLVDANATTATVRHEQLPVLRLEALLGHGDNNERRPGVVVSFAGKSFVGTVDKIVGPREIIIKPLGPLLAPLTLYAAATISGSGKVQLILDPAQLVRRVYPDVQNETQPDSGATSIVLAGRALVVDDSRAIREAMTSMLGREGWIVDVAEDGARALQMTRQLRYDLVVTDLEMPEVNGFDLIARLRADERFKTTPIVIITSRAHPEHRRRARELGVRALVAKPITRRKLLEALATRCRCKLDVVSRAVVLGVIALVGCYEPPVDSCGIHCTDTCPGNLICTAEHVCRGADGSCAAAPIEFATIGAGSRHVCGLDLDGAIWCWGDNDTGQLGSTVAPYGLVPTEVVDPGVTWQAVAVGGEHTCGLHDGEIDCWGQNLGGQVAGTKGGMYTSPTPVMFATGSAPPVFDHVAAGGSHTCALAAGTLWCWGTLPQTGTGITTVTVATQVGTISDWTQLSTGFDHSCGISASMGVMCWGANQHHQCGVPTGNNIRQPTPVAMPSGLTAESVTAGTLVSCAIMNDTTLWCWGFNNGSQIIDDTATDPAIPTQIGTEGGWTAISIANRRACGVRSGNMYCWGTSQVEVGGLGDGVWDEFQVPPTAAEQIGPADDVAIGIDAPTNDEVDEIGCLRSGTSVSCWGDNQHGTLGIGAATSHLVPIAIPPPAGLTWKHIISGHQHTCAETTDGALWCWGADYSGQVTATAIGRGTTQPCVPNEPCDQPLPVAAPAGVAPFDEIVAGVGFTCTRTGGAIRCWGDNQIGQLGVQGSTGVTTVQPTAPATGGWTQMLGGDFGTCAFAQSGELDCWGSINGSWLYTPTDTSSPELHDLASLSLSQDASCGARTTDQARVCFGSNTSNQYGDGTNISALMPTAIDIGTIESVSMSSQHGCAIMVGGQVACWGANYYGEVGVSTGATIATPSIGAGRELHGAARGLHGHRRRAGLLLRDLQRSGVVLGNQHQRPDRRTHHLDDERGRFCRTPARSHVQRARAR